MQKEMSEPATLAVEAMNQLRLEIVSRSQIAASFTEAQDFVSNSPIQAIHKPAERDQRRVSHQGRESRN